jgi:hypothetical protein
MPGDPMRAVPIVTVLAAVFAAGLARAQDGPAGEAAVHFDRGAALASEHKYAEAALEFKASYENDPRKEALFAWAQMERLAGSCVAAVALYQRFLAQPDLTASQREAAELNQRRCEPAPGRPGPRIEGELDPPPPPVSVARAPEPAVVATPATRSRRAVLVGAAMLTGAAAALAGSATFFLLARDDEREASSAPIWDDYYKAMRRAHDRQRLAAGALGAGVLLGGGALLHWMLTTPAPPRLTAWAGQRTIGLRGRF